MRSAVPSLSCQSFRVSSIAKCISSTCAQRRGFTRSSVTMERTYNDALHHLYMLQSNRHITSLFDKSSTPAPSTASSKSPAAPDQKTRDMNAAAIPEMITWLKRARYTPRDLARMRHIHVAGTKGKGSVCAYATSLLMRCRDGPVGTFTSPHLVSPRERIAIDGEPVAQDLFAKAFFEVWDRFSEAAREQRGGDDVEGVRSKPFYFRFMTILAWHIFLQQGVKDVVMECGIGGEYDSTNVLPPEAVSAAVISQLGIDHVAMLGDTTAKIAWHKAGIMKPGVKCFTRQLVEKPMVMDVLRARANEKGGELVEVDDELVEAWGGVEGTLKGDFQKYNQALALLAVKQHLGLETSPATSLQHVSAEMLDGLRRAKLRGRCEVIEDGNNTWLLDGAHTKDSLEQAASWVASQIAAGEFAILVFNQQERDATQLLNAFINAVKKTTGRQIFSNALFTRNDQSKAAEGETRDLAVQRDAASTMQVIDTGCKTEVFDNISETVARARDLADSTMKKQKILVTGSLHLVGGILLALEPETLL